MVPLESDEKQLQQVRAHPIFLLVDGLTLLTGIVGPLLIASILFAFEPTSALGGAMFSLWPLYPLWIMIVWSHFFVSLTFYFMRYLLITNERIIEVEQKGFFDREVSSFRLENIQDITVDVQGVLASLLDYGDILIQTASKDRNFVIRNAPHPEALKLLISQEHERVMKRFMVPTSNIL
jgi:uncharacterized membrane protein YdbT with pleckstrin-like domain